MKVTVPLTIDVDTDAWARMYGLAGAAKIREDVRLYVLHSIQSLAPMDEGGFRSVGLSLPNRPAHISGLH